MEQFNIFKTLNVTNQEIKHSDVLGWLLDSNGNHELNDNFLKEFIYEIETESSKSLNLTIDNSYKIYREYKVEKGFVDIVLISSKNKSIIVIENKIKAKESTNQLTKYKEYFQEKAKGYSLVLIFLTLYNDKPKDPDYIGINYIPVIKTLDRIFRYEIRNFKVKYFLEDYMAILMSKYNLKEIYDLTDFRKLAKLKEKERN